MLPIPALRPVVSMVDTPEYNLAKYLDYMIKPYIPDTHLLRSTEDFFERLKQFPCNDKCVLVSLMLFLCLQMSHFRRLLI